MTKGLLTAAEVSTIFSNLETWLNVYRTTLGRDPYNETSTAVAKAQTALEAIIGDGTSSIPGIGASELQRLIIQPLGNLVARSTYYDFAAGLLLPIIQQIDNHIQIGLPSEWSLSNARPLDWWLTRLNATSTSTPSTPSTAPTVIAITGGAIDSCIAGNAPSIVYTLVASDGRYESLASPETSGVALAGSNSGYNVTISGTVPSGVYFVRLYRTLTGSPTGTKYYVSQTSVTPGQPFPAILVKEPDSQLRYDISPPSYCQALRTQGEATIYALAYSVNGQLVSSMMQSAHNVRLVPSNSWTGINGIGAVSILAQRVVGTAFTSGSVISTNDAVNGIQGCIGATTLRVRVTSALNAGASITNVGYMYITSASSTAASGVVAGPISLTATLGSVATVTIPAGRVVVGVTTDTCGTAASGTYIYEASS